MFEGGALKGIDQVYNINANKSLLAGVSISIQVQLGESK
jgi:hypothetical protein